MQLAAPDQLRGRIIGIYFYAFNGTGPVGGLLAGWLCAKGGTELAFVVAGALGLAGTAVAAQRLAAATAVVEPTAPRERLPRTRGRVTTAARLPTSHGDRDLRVGGHARPRPGSARGRRRASRALLVLRLHGELRLEERGARRARPSGRRRSAPAPPAGSSPRRPGAGRRCRPAPPPAAGASWTIGRPCRTPSDGIRLGDEARRLDLAGARRQVLARRRRAPTQSRRRCVVCFVVVCAVVAVVVVRLAPWSSCRPDGVPFETWITTVCPCRGASRRRASARRRCPRGFAEGPTIACTANPSSVAPRSPAAAACRRPQARCFPLLVSRKTKSQRRSPPTARIPSAASHGQTSLPGGAGRRGARRGPASGGGAPGGGPAGGGVTGGWACVSSRGRWGSVISFSSAIPGACPKTTSRKIRGRAASLLTGVETVGRSPPRPLLLSFRPMFAHETEPTEVADGVLRLGTDLVNWYLVEDAGRVTIVDAGTPAYRPQLEAGLAKLGRDRRRRRGARAHARPRRPHGLRGRCSLGARHPGVRPPR